MAVLEHRWKSFAVSLVFLAAGMFLMTRLPTQFFPTDLQYLSYVDLWLPNNVSLARTDEVAARAAAVVREVAAQYGKERPGRDGKPREVLRSVNQRVNRCNQEDATCDMTGWRERGTAELRWRGAPCGAWW